MSATLSSRVGLCVISHRPGESALMVTSEISRLWARVRGILIPKSELELAEGEGGSEYGGEGGNGEMGLWKEQKEWNESTLDDRLADSASACMGSRWAVIVLDGAIVCRDRCGGAVTALPALNPFGLVGVFRLSGVGSQLPTISSRSTAVASASISCSLSVLRALLPSEAAAVSSSVVLDSCASPATKDCDRCLGRHGRFRIGILGCSGKGTVKPLLKGHGVTSYCNTLASTPLNSSTFSMSSAVEYESSIR